MLNYPLHCPTCETVLITDTQQVFNIQDNQTLKASVLSGTFFFEKCDTCQTKSFILRPFVYVDAVNEFAVALVPDYPQMSEGQFLQWNEFIQLKLPHETSSFQCRLTTHFEEFKEKILLLEAQQNDQLAEIIKLLTDGVFINQYYEAIKARFFQAPLSDLNRLLYVTDEHQRLVNIPSSLIQFAFQEYEKATTHITPGQWHRVNMQWATNLLEGQPGHYQKNP